MARGTSTEDAVLTEAIHEATERPRLAWTDAAGRHELVIDGPKTLGSSPSADVVVVDQAVSRVHAALEPRADGLWIRDLGSRNGTTVEEVLVGSARVPHKGKVGVGRTLLRVSYRREDVTTQAWARDDYGPLVGRSAGMRRLFAKIDRAAKTDLSVLVHGETGTGKDVVARALHEASARGGGPFVVVDCAALPEHLASSELFGHARGAFTGADRAREGAVEAADGGTLFFDEIGELPLSMQPKLLRVLETREVQRVGETKRRAVDVRFVCATHRDLRELVNGGVFREDLYFRLAVLTLEVPPLRDRAEDVALLVDRFAPALAASERSSLLRALRGRPWPGNVRELRNVVDRAAALGCGALSESRSMPAGAQGLPIDLAVDVPWKTLRDEVVEDLERRYLAALLERHGRNVTAVAQASGLARTYVHKLIRRYAL